MLDSLSGLACYAIAAAFMHDYVPLIVLFLGVLAEIWLNRRDFSESKADTNRQFDAVNRQLEAINRRLDCIDEDLRQFYGTDKALEGRINELSARIK